MIALHWGQHQSITFCNWWANLKTSSHIFRQQRFMYAAVRYHLYRPPCRPLTIKHMIVSVSLILPTNMSGCEIRVDELRLSFWKDLYQVFRFPCFPACVSSAMPSRVLTLMICAWYPLSFKRESLLPLITLNLSECWVKSEPKMGSWRPGYSWRIPCGGNVFFENRDKALRLIISENVWYGQLLFPKAHK